MKIGDDLRLSEKKLVAAQELLQVLHSSLPSPSSSSFSFLLLPYFHLYLLLNCSSCSTPPVLVFLLLPRLLVLSHIHYISCYSTALLLFSSLSLYLPFPLPSVPLLDHPACPSPHPSLYIFLSISGSAILIYSLNNTICSHT
jgi:hypothetical protein